MENLKMGTPEALSQITELKIPEEQLEKEKKILCVVALSLYLSRLS